MFTGHKSDSEQHRRRNDFSVGEAKIGEKQSRQSNSKYNFMHENSIPMHLYSRLNVGDCCLKSAGMARYAGTPA